MNPLTPLQRDVRRDQLYREALLAQPLDYFNVYFGRVPDQMERIQFVEKLVQVLAAPNVFVNDTYYIQMKDAAPFIHLNIARCDGEPCNSWRDFQAIKNELVGPENEAVQLFPAESRLVDTANQYHLWVMADSQYRFPFGYHRRLVFEQPLVHPSLGADGMAQAPLPADRPAAAAIWQS